MQIAALIVAAGRGVRAMQPDGLPKQYAEIAGASVLAHAVRAFLEVERIGCVQVVIGNGDEELYRAGIGDQAAHIRPPVAGGDTRQASVLAGLEALTGVAPDLVLIHDGARPFVSRDIIERIVAGLELLDGAVAGMPVVDTLKVAGKDLVVASTLPREHIWRAQTPQGFRYPSILAAHRAAARAGLGDFTDDAAVAEWAGLRIGMVRGSERNVKLTTAEDISLARVAIEGAMPVEYRSGTGFDVHRFTDGDHVWLCGVRIAHGRGLEGHSDADVALHALTDALLGAMGAGDIGEHFPPGDPKWKGAASWVFLDAARKLVDQAGGRIVNVDITVVCEAPRLGPHRAVMRSTVAHILGIDEGRVNIKATTTEGLGFPGRQEGIAAMASASVALPA